jgi:uncharacterized protein with beta-barrel porin domain
VAGLSHNIGGIVVGADTRVADDRVTLGVSVAAADMSTKASDGSGFSGDVRALDVGGYLDATYSRGYLSAAVRYTDLRHDTRRSSGHRWPAAAAARPYSNDAISARVEHAFSFTTGKGLVIQPLLPVVDYARTSATRFNEGQGAGALVGSGSLESIRVGAGLQLFKTFEGNNGERITRVPAWSGRRSWAIRRRATAPVLPRPRTWCLVPAARPWASRCWPGTWA